MPHATLAKPLHTAGAWLSGAALSALILVSSPAETQAQLSLQPQSLLPSEARTRPVAAARPPIPTEFPPLADIKELPIREVTLSNGLRVFLLEDHEVPLVKASIAMRGGQRASPPNRVGLATITAAVQRAGGTQAHPGPELDETLEQMAAGIEGGALPEAVVLGYQCLKEDTEQVTGLLAELLTAPLLPEDKLRLYKGQILNILEHENDNASAIPRREMSRLLYGADSVYARRPKKEQVQAMSRDDLAEYIMAWERPDSAVMGVLGDFDSAEMIALLERSLSGWRVNESLPKEPPGIPSSPVPEMSASGPRLYFVERPGATQASVLTGEVGVKLTDPDTPALDVLNNILNSFGGRLFNEIRSREGLAYSVSGGFNTSALDHPGLFVAGGETAAPDEFLAALERVLLEATLVEPSEEIVATAKARTLNSFVFNFSSTDAQLQRVIGYSLVGLPQDYLFQYRDRIERVTASDVLTAAKKHLHPLQQTAVVVADATAITGLEAQGRSVSLLKLDR